MTTTDSPTDQRKHFISLLKKFHTAMLVTLSDVNEFHARPMAIARVEDDGRLWFVTDADSGKVREIKADAHIFLTAQEGDSAFLALEGHATLSGDRAKIAELWHEAFRVWFPAGKDDPNIELISVRPQRAEFWDSTGLNRCKYLWEATKAYVTGTTPAMNDGNQHAVLTL
jgi:general stress protein 26